MKSFRRAAVTALFLGVAATPAHATWSHDPYLGNNPVCLAAGQQSQVSMIPDGSGGTLYAWTDMRIWPTDIYVQHLDAHGTALWGAGGMVAVNAAESQEDPAAVSDGAGGMILTWSDRRSGVSSDVFAMRINAAGVPLWTAIICTATDVQRYTIATTDGAGGAIIAWEDRRSGVGHIYARRVRSDGTTLWTSNGTPVCTAAGGQSETQITSDGAGGAWLAWTDVRSGTNSDIYVQRINGLGIAQFAADGALAVYDPADQRLPRIAADGVGGLFLCWFDHRSGTDWDVYGNHMGPGGGLLWVSNGYAIATTTVRSTSPSLCADQQGGVIVAWEDLRSGGEDVDIYGQHLTFSGGYLWAATGTPLADGTAVASQASLLADGLGGAFLVWADQSSMNDAPDLYGQHLRSDGTREWAARGVAITRAPMTQDAPTVTTDGSGGLIASWMDARNLEDWELYAQRVDGYGTLGEAEPAALSVRDASNDQGGRVKVAWNRSYLDALPTYGISEYRVWRSIPQASAGALAARRGTSRDAEDAFASGRLFLRAFGAQDYAWEPVGSVAAATLASYSFVATTTCDSLAGSNPRTTFMVEARGGTLVSSPRWFSAPDSGYSVDNLGPAAPAPFTGQYTAGQATLHWQPNHEADLAGYRLYRGLTPSFVANSASLVATLADTTYVDQFGEFACYRLTAVDLHGNESAAIALKPTGTLEAGDGAFALQTDLARPRPNPVSRAATLSFVLAAAGRARLAVYDAAGREVRTLMSGSLEATTHTVTWDLLDSGGQRAAAGLYFVRLSTPTATRIQRIVVTE